jgi:hypothetical protein
VSERPDDFRFLGYSGLVVLTASLSESDRDAAVPGNTKGVCSNLTRAGHAKLQSSS